MLNRFVEAFNDFVFFKLIRSRFFDYSLRLLCQNVTRVHHNERDRCENDWVYDV